LGSARNGPGFASQIPGPAMCFRSPRLRRAPLPRGLSIRAISTLGLSRLGRCAWKSRICFANSGYRNVLPIPAARRTPLPRELSTSRIFALVVTVRDVASRRRLRGSVRASRSARAPSLRR
jgi:hypothetical protein